MSFAMLLLALAMSSSSFAILRASTRQIVEDRTQAAADAGLEVGLAQLQTNSSYAGNTTKTLLGDGPETYRVQVLRSPSLLPNGQPIPSDCSYVIGIGERAGVTTASSVALIRPPGSVKGLDAIFADKIAITALSIVNSFDSRVSYTARTRNANVVTNSTDPGSVMVGLLCSVFGTVQVGPGGKVESGPVNPLSVTAFSDFTVWHNLLSQITTTTTMTSTKSVPPVILPANPTGGTNLNILTNTTLVPGTYGNLACAVACNINLQGGATYVFDNLSLTALCSLKVVGTEPVKVYVKSRADLLGAITVNQGRAPSLLQIYMGDGSTYTQSGASFVDAVIYGPEATVVTDLATTLYGAIVANNVTMLGASIVNYDEALKDFVLSSTASQVLFRQRFGQAP